MSDYREKEMKYLLIAYILLFFLFCTDILQNLPKESKSLLEIAASAFESAALAGVVSLFVFIVDSVIGSRFKNKLTVFFVIPRTGNVIFSKISTGKPIDERFSTQEAMEKYKTIIAQLPSEKKERRKYENAQWYKIYYDYREQDSILEAQKEYLTCRDLFIETVTFILVYLLAIWLLKKWVCFSYEFLLILCGIAILTNIATHKKMHSFVYGVIARDIADDEIP